MLRMSKKVEYALIAMVEMTYHKDTELITAKEIAKRYHIPQEILGKVLQALYQTEADIITDHEKKTLTVKLHHMANESMDNAVRKMCDELNATKTKFPRTELQLILKVGSNQSSRDQEF